MSKKSYRDILTRYIQEHKVEDAILTDQVVQYAAEELGKDAAEVKKAVNVTMARLEKDGYVIRLAKGVYCKKVKTAFGFYMPNKDDLFCRQLLQDKDKIIGYETGLSALNRLGLVSQMPKKICIASNLHQKRVPEGIQVEVRKPPIAVNSENYRYLQILDTIRDLDRAPAQAPHSMQVSALISYLPLPSEIADTGHSASQAPQLMQASVILYAMGNTPPFDATSLYQYAA